ncbi:MAG TPA: hypothetical protein DCX41_05625, partial [Aequorivita sp.]|nr:hypothetical protein [Aequorivita sp.]
MINSIKSKSRSCYFLIIQLKMDIMNVKHCILIILLVSYYKVNAQKIYTTEEGHIMMMTLVN